jgi:hypothetical protein
MNYWIILVLLIFASVANAQLHRVRELWVQKFPQSSWNNIIPDNLGRIAAYGLSPTGKVVVLLNPDGDTVASVAAPEFSQVVAADNQGNIYLAGNCALGAVACAVKIRFGLDGLLWSRSFEFPIGGLGLVPKGLSILDSATDAGGNLYLTGEYHPDSGGADYNAVALSFAEAGTVWMNPYAFAPFDHDTGIGVRVAPNGIVYFVGVTSHFRIQGNSIFALGYASDGTRIWATNYVSPTGDGVVYDYSEVPVGIAVDSQGNLLVTGWRSDDGLFGSRKYVTLKIAPSGEVLWRTTFDTSSPNDSGSAVVADSSGNVIVTGLSGTVKYSPQGAELWRSREVGSAVAIDSEANVVISGSVTDRNGQRSVETTKLRADGRRLWQASYRADKQSDNALVDIVIDETNAVYIGVNSTGPDEAAIIKYVDRERTFPAK